MSREAVKSTHDKTPHVLCENRGSPKLVGLSFISWFFISEKSRKDVLSI
jgi:hypothetical protein